MRKEFLATYKTLAPYIMIKNSEAQDTAEMTSTSANLEFIQDQLTPIYRQQEIFQYLREFVRSYENYSDYLSITQKRNITRILNKLHED